MAKTNPFPEEGELVVGTVREVQNFGAFITLEEYPGKEGFVHIREVASGWVKRIRDHVRENARVVCKTLGVNHQKGHIDLSLKAVNDHQRREAIQAWKNEQKADKFFELFAAQQGKPVPDLMKAYGNQLVETFGTMWGAFSDAAELGEDVFKEEGITGAWVADFVAFAKQNIQAAFVEIAGYVEVQSPAADGASRVSKALAAAEQSEFEDVEIQVSYVGAPHYRIQVKAPDYKIAEEQLKKAADNAVAAIVKVGGSGAFHRELEVKH